MDLNNGRKPAIYGSLLLLFGILAMLVLEFWMAVGISTIAYPTGISANGILNSSVNSIQLQQAQDSVIAIVDPALFPVIASIVVQMAGFVLLTIAFAAFGKTYKDAKMAKYGYYGTALLVVSLVIELVLVAVAGPIVLISVLFLPVFILTLIGIILYMMVLGRLAASTSVKRFQYYGYALAVGAVLNLANPLGLIVFIVIFALLVLNFMNMSKSSGMPGKLSPFETAEITSDASVKKGKK